MSYEHPKYVQERLGYASIIEGIDGGLGDAMDEAL
jgi:hypothetical protein